MEEEGAFEQSKWGLSIWSSRGCICSSQANKFKILPECGFKTLLAVKAAAVAGFRILQMLLEMAKPDKCLLRVEASEANIASTQKMESNMGSGQASNCCSVFV